MIKPRVASYAVYEPPEEGWENWETSFKTLNAALSAAGLEVLAAPEAVKDPPSYNRVAAWLKSQEFDLLHALVITWSFDHYTIQLQQQVQKPVAIRSLPGIRTGSLVGGMQLSCVLHDLEADHKLFYGALEQHQIIQDTVTYSWACALRNRLRGANLAVIGRRTEGMTPTAVDEVEILRLFGIRMLHYGLDEFFEYAQSIPQERAQAAWEEVQRAAVQVTSHDEHGVASMRYYLALRQLIAEQNLAAITVGSYPKCQGTMCLPLALLNDTAAGQRLAFPAGCEGDVNSTIAMLLLSMLSDQPVHFGEMLAVDETSNSLVTSHCGCGSPTLADEKGFMLCPVRLANDGVCVRFSAKPGPITYLNLVGRKGNYRMCALQGQAEPTELVFEGNPLRFTLQTPFRRSWEAIVNGGFGHHWMAGYTHAAPVLQEFCRLTHLQGVFPDLET